MREPEAGSARVCLPKPWRRQMACGNQYSHTTSPILWTNESALTVCVWAIGWPAPFPSEHPPLPFPKRAVIYRSWALRSCVLWCLIQGPTARQGGERGCVGNSPGLRSRNSDFQQIFPVLLTLGSSCLYDCCAVTLCRTWRCREYDLPVIWSQRCLHRYHKNVLCISRLVSMVLLEWCLKHCHPEAAALMCVNSIQNNNFLLYCITIIHLTFTLRLSSTTSLSVSPASSLTLSFCSLVALWDLFQLRAAPVRGSC